MNVVVCRTRANINLTTKKRECGITLKYLLIATASTQIYRDVLVVDTRAVIKSRPLASYALVTVASIVRGLVIVLALVTGL